MANRDWQVYAAKGRVGEREIRALKEFLEQTEEPSEKQLHDFLIRYPCVVGALGFIAFSPEFTLSKRDGEGQLIDGDRRRRNRVDLLGARQSRLTRASGEPFISAHLIELKGPREPLVRNRDGARLTTKISEAVGQLHDYRRDLTQVPENTAAVRALGWEVTAPAMLLIAGSEREFHNRPAQLDVVRDDLFRQEVHLVLIEDLVRAAERSCAERYAFDVSICTDLHEQRMLSFRPTILDLSSKRVFPERLPPKPQFDRNVQLAPDGQAYPRGDVFEAMSVVEKYVFQTTPEEKERVREAGAQHIEMLFTHIWMAACTSVHTVPIVDPVGHSSRSRAIWLGESAASLLGLADAWIRWHESRFAPPLKDVPPPIGGGTVLWGFDCACGAQYDLDPAMAREIRSFKCRRCGRTITTI